MIADAVVTDVDGVLVDTSESYHRAIVETVRALHGRSIDRSDTQAFKNAGGFNNDWRTTDAIVLYVLARRNGLDADVDTFTDAVAERGGGLEGARRVLDDALDPETVETVLEGWDPTAVRRTFQWLYLGPDRYDELESEPAPTVRPEPAGFIDDEPVILDPAVGDSLADRGPVGILTGRPKREARIALERVALSPRADRIVTMDDWEGGKPDPAGLIRIAETTEATRIAYVGDELDDVRTAIRADDADADRSYVAIGVLTGGLRGQEGRERFDAIGADLVLPSINGLPAALDD